MFRCFFIGLSCLVSTNGPHGHSLHPSLSTRGEWLPNATGIHSVVACTSTFRPPNAMLLLWWVPQVARKVGIDWRFVSQSACDAPLRWVHYWRQRGHSLARIAGLLQSQINEEAFRSIAQRKACLVMPRAVPFGYHYGWLASVSNQCPAQTLS
jgi:hypothetical protein